MKKLFIAVILITILAEAVLAKDLRARTQLNPLDCALYLLQEDSKDIDSSQAEVLANAFWQSGRRDDAFRTIKLVQRPDDQVRMMSRLISELILNNEKAESKKFLLEAFAVAQTEDDWSSSSFELSQLAAKLAAVSLDAEAVKLSEISSEAYVKTDVLIEIAAKYANRNENEKALRLLVNALQTAQETDSEFEYKAKIGFVYAKANQPQKALSLLTEVEQVYLPSLDGDNRRDVLFSLISGFIVVGEIEKAFLLWQTYGDLQDNYSIRKVADAFLADNQKDKMLLVLAQTTDVDYSLLVEFYLKLNEKQKAFKAAIQISESFDNYEQQTALLKVADKFIADGEAEPALEIIDFAFVRVKKIDTSEPETAFHSIGATPASRKARYICAVADAYMRLEQFDKALAAINSLEKPFYRAEKLTDFAEKQIGKAPARKIAGYLSQALQIVRTSKEQFLDANRYMVMAKIANASARTGAKNNANSILAEILSKQEEIKSEGGENHLFEVLTKVGVVFEKYDLPVDAKVKKQLQLIIKNWNE